MKLKVEFKTPTNGSKAVNILNRLTHDLDGKRLRPGQRYLLVGDSGEPVGMARVVSPPRTTAEHAASVMQPVIDGLGAYGSVKRLRDTYAAMTGERPHPATWHRWLHTAPALRMQPAVGTALAIRAAFERMQQETAKKARKP